MMITNVFNRLWKLCLLGVVIFNSGCGDLLQKQPDLKIELFTVTPAAVAAPLANQAQTITITRRVNSSTGKYDLSWLIAPLDAMLETTGSAAEFSQFKPPYENSRGRFLAADYLCSESACVNAVFVSVCTYRTVTPATGTDQTLTREIRCEDSSLKIAPGKYQWFAVANTSVGKEVFQDSAQSRFSGNITLE
jgi:hypothetical protein